MRKTLTAFPFSHSKNVSQAAANCHSGPQEHITGLPLIAIVGSPNVGKSVLFNTLTGIYATVSNYPGTTVEVTRGKGRLSGVEAGVMDTRGCVLPITEETRRPAHPAGRAT
jgi:ferrous iron transport protein B